MTAAVLSLIDEDGGLWFAGPNRAVNSSLEAHVFEFDPTVADYDAPPVIVGANLLWRKGPKYGDENGSRFVQILDADTFDVLAEIEQNACGVARILFDPSERTLAWTYAP